MYNVPIPSITDEVILKYLCSDKHKSKLVHEWKWRQESKKAKGTKTITVTTEHTNRPTYEEMITCDAFPHDKAFTWPEQFYDERGHAIGKTKKKIFSLHRYGRFLHQIAPHNILLQLKNSGLTYDTTESAKEYITKVIETPDVLFKNLVFETQLKHQDPDYSTQSKVIEKVQTLLSAMIWKYPTFAIHIDFKRSLNIWWSYNTDKNTWDRWYISQLLAFAPRLFQRPYYSKKNPKISIYDGVYAYHLFTFQTLYFNNKRQYFTRKELQALCGNHLKKVEEFTPKAFRIHYKDLTWEKQQLVQKCYGLKLNRYVHFIEDVIHERLNKRIYSKKGTYNFSADEMQTLLEKKFPEVDMNEFTLGFSIEAIIDKIPWLVIAEDSDQELNRRIGAKVWKKEWGYGADYIAWQNKPRSQSVNLIQHSASTPKIIQETLSEQEKMARAYITKFIYNRSLLGTRYANKISDTYFKEMIKGLKSYIEDEEKRKTFLKRIITQYKNGIYDGMTLKKFVKKYYREGNLKEGEAEYRKIKKESTKQILT